MLAVIVELLTGRYTATAYNDRDTVEWPPHPARLFSALVATLCDDTDQSNEHTRGRAALEWLEQLPPPEILASAVEVAGARAVVPVFVPVNDVNQVGEVDRSKLDAAEAGLVAETDTKKRVKLQKDVEKLRAKYAADTAKAISAPTKFSKERRAGLEELPEHRGKQPRTFPTATPASSRFAFAWPTAAPPNDTVVALERLLCRLVRLGHSSCFVRASLATEADVEELRPHVTVFRPDPRDGDLVIRWVTPGQLGRLVQAFEQHRETEPHVLPADFVRYTTQTNDSGTAVLRSVFSDHFMVFARTAGPRLPVTAVAALSRQFRRALMSYADEPIDPLLSGHGADGGPAQQAHAALLPLPVVIGPHADGAVIGVALMLPRECSEQSRRAVLRAIGKYEAAHREDAREEIPDIKLTLGEAGVVWLRRVAWGDERTTLDPKIWTRQSRRWATATPIALDRNPGDLHDQNPVKRGAAFDAARTIVNEAIARIGLPQPVEIDVLRSCVLPGTAKPQTYPRYPSNADRTQRVLVHARLLFPEPVLGPIVIGAGRFNGLGLCLPVDGSERWRP